MKIIVFGLGDIYSKVKQYFYNEEEEIVALVDNSQKLFRMLLDGHIVDKPENIQQYQYDFIVLTSNAAVEMRQQLMELGIPSDKVIHFLDYLGRIPLKLPVSQMEDLTENVLILANDLGYHGGPITSVNLARVLKENGYKVTIATSDAEQRFLDEISSEEGVKIIVIENLDYLSKENLEWTNRYTYVLANTFVMARCAIKLSEKRKVYLWLHESIDIYAGYEYWHDEIAAGLANEQLIIGAVSDVARKNFLSVYHMEKEIELLPYGIGDRYKGNEFCVEKETTVFTVVANHISLKGLDVLLDALHFVSEEAESQYRFLFAGKTYDNEYGELIRNYIDKSVNCEYLGELSRENLFEVYSATDIVIIPSRRDSLPLVATEAMMLKKPCVISDTTGTAKYIRHKYNGLIFESENREELAEMIGWCLKNKEELKQIAENARKTYETWFTMKIFGERVMRVMEKLS